MAVRYIRNILTPPHTDHHSSEPQPLSSLIPWQFQERNGEGGNEGREVGDDDGVGEGDLGEETDAMISGVHFEEPVSLYAFTRSRNDLLRLDSVPWDLDHHWSGDNHGHTHQEVRQGEVNTASVGRRVRSGSDGTQVVFYSIPPQAEGTGLGPDPKPQVKGEGSSNTARGHLPPLLEETQTQGRGHRTEGSSEDTSPRSCPVESNSNSDHVSCSPPSPPLPPPPADSQDKTTKPTPGAGTDLS